VENFVMKRSRRVLAISQHVRGSLIAQGVDARVVDVLPHGVPDPMETDGNEEKVLIPGSQDNKKVVVVGRLSKQKRLERVLAAAEVFLSSGATDLIFVGDGPERTALEDRVRSSTVLSGHVYLTGFVPRTTAIEIVKQADVSLVPLGGYSLIEAALCGQAVVAFDNEWHSEIIVNEKTGLLVSPDDEVAIATAVERLLTDSELRRRVAANLRQEALQRHHEIVAQENRRTWYETKVLD